MKKLLKQLGFFAIALGLIAGILGIGIYSSQQLRHSTVVAGSKVLRAIVSEDSVGILSFVQNAEKRGMLRGFMSAVTDAYVNFELIPVNEGKTFTAIFTSINDEVLIEQFVYHRRDLELSGTATSEGYERFLKELEEDGHFYKIQVVSTTVTEQNVIEFVINCQAQPMSTPGTFLE